MPVQKDSAARAMQAWRQLFTAQRSEIHLARPKTNDDRRNKAATFYVAQRAISKRISGSGGSSGALAGRMTLITEPALTGVSVMK
jgi:hypothetical protein